MSYIFFLIKISFLIKICYLIKNIRYNYMIGSELMIKTVAKYLTGNNKFIGGSSNKNNISI